MAGRARVGDLVFVRHCGRDELESVRTHETAGHTLGFDLRHVAGYALSARAAALMVGVCLQTRAMGAVRRRRTMTVQAELVYGLSELGIVFRSVYIVA